MPKTTNLPPAGFGYLNDVLGARSIEDYAAATAQMRSAQFSAMQQMAQQAANQAKQDYDAKLADIKKHVDLLYTKNKDMFNYPSVQQQIEREKALAAIEYQNSIARAQAYTMDKDSGERLIKQTESQLNNQYKNQLKTAEEQENFKSAKENWGRVHKQVTITGQLGEQAKTLKGLIDAGKMDDAESYAKAVVTKTLNSLISPDALGMTEMLIKFPSLVSAQDQALLRGASPLSAKDVVYKVMQRWDGSLEKSLMDAYKTDPLAFTRVAARAYNDNANAFNQDVTESVINATSPKVAAESIGARLLKPLGNDFLTPPSFSSAAGAPAGQGGQAGGSAQPQAEQQPPKVEPVNPPKVEPVNPQQQPAQQQSTVPRYIISIPQSNG